MDSDQRTANNNSAKSEHADSVIRRMSISIIRMRKRLQRFVSEQGKIIPRRITGNLRTPSKRQLVTAIKRARHLALISFVNDAVS